MRSVIQRVSCASVAVGGEVVGEIGPGLLVFLGVGKEDSERDLEWMVGKILRLRCFEDESGKMNLSLLDIRGAILCVSQFTLYGDCRRGHRPSFDGAAEAPWAMGFYQKFIDRMRDGGIIVETGRFGAKMRIRSENEGPVTLILDSRV